MSGTPATPSEGSPSMVTRRVGAGIQARLAKLQGAAGPPAITREMPKRFPNGYDDPFKERLDGTLRRSLSGTWSMHTGDADTSATSTDESHTLVESQPNTALPVVNEEAELKRRRDFTKNWEQQQQTVVKLLSPEPFRIQSSPQPIIEEPELEEEVATNKHTPAPAPVPVPEPKDPKHGILTPPISEPESTPVRKPETKPASRPQTTPSKRVRPPPSAFSPPAAPVAAKATPQTPSRLRPRASAPATPSSSTLAPPVPRLHLTPSSARTKPPSALLAPPRPHTLAPPRPHTSMSSRRASAPERRIFSSKVPEKVLPPPVRPRTISKIYEGPTAASLAKQKPSVSPRGPMSRAVSRTSCL